MFSSHCSNKFFIPDQVLAKNSVSDIEKREKKVLEKKLGEMEDELKVIQYFNFHSLG